MDLDLSGVTPVFKSMLEGISSISPRPDVAIAQIPSPKGIAPEAIAISAEVVHTTASDHGVSRLVFCRDESMPEGWHSAFRIIGYAKSPIELDMAKDDFTSSMPWEWLKDTLSKNGASFEHEAGTTTTVISTGHGSLVSQPQHAELEIRASWAPVDENLAGHLVAWIELLALISGLPPADEKVVRLG